MNVVILIGNLTKDPEVRYTTASEPMAVTKFSLAINEGYGDKKKVSYPNVVVFGKTAENCEKYLAKGSKVCVKGHLQTGSYEGKNGKVYTTDVIADSVEFLSRKEPDGYQELKEDDLEW